jgi:hypothetical protein
LLVVVVVVVLFEATVMRKIMHGVLLKNGCIISHFHDSIQCHPNYFEAVFNVIPGQNLDENFSVDNMY